MRMRTLEQIYNHILENDPDTCLTKSGLYRLIRSGEIPSIKCGKKRLIGIEAVEAYLNGECAQQPEAAVETDKIQRIDAAV